MRLSQFVAAFLGQAVPMINETIDYAAHALQLGDMLSLSDAGLVTTEPLGFLVKPTSEKFEMTCQGRRFSVESEVIHCPEIETMVRLTNAGYELLSVCQPAPDQLALDHVVTSFRDRAYKVDERSLLILAGQPRLGRWRLYSATVSGRAP